MSNFTLPEQAKVLQALPPAADAAGRAGAWVSCKFAHKTYIIVLVAQGNAATVALTINQAQDESGTGAKAITAAVPIWFCTDESVSDALVPQTAAVSFTTDAGLKNKIVIFEIDPAKLDQANGFHCVQVVTGASNVANITAAIYQGQPLRYLASTPPSALTT